MEYYRNVRLSPEMEEARRRCRRKSRQAYEEASVRSELMRTKAKRKNLPRSNANHNDPRGDEVAPYFW